MPRTIEYPSAALPAPPRISLESPDEWELLVVPGVQMAVAEPPAPGRFRANLVITLQRVGAATDLAALTRDLERRKAALPQLEELGTGELTIADRTWLASEYGYTAPGAATVVQAVRYTIVERGDVADVVEVVGSCGADRADDVIETLRRMQDTVRIAAS